MTLRPLNLEWPFFTQKARSKQSSIQNFQEITFESFTFTNRTPHDIRRVGQTMQFEGAALARGTGEIHCKGPLHIPAQSNYHICFSPNDVVPQEERESLGRRKVFTPFGVNYRIINYVIKHYRATHRFGPGGNDTPQELTRSRSISKRGVKITRRTINFPAWT